MSSSTRIARCSSCLSSDVIAPEEVEMPDEVTFAQDIRPLFRDRDVRSMSFAFDLSSYEDVRTNAEEIYERLAALEARAVAAVGSFRPREQERARDDGGERKHAQAAEDSGRHRLVEDDRAGCDRERIREQRREAGDGQ